MCGIKAMLHVDRIGIYKLYKQRALDRGCHLDLRFYRLDNQLLNSSFGGGGGGGGVVHKYVFMGGTNAHALHGPDISCKKD